MLRKIKRENYFEQLDYLVEIGMLYTSEALELKKEIQEFPRNVVIVDFEDKIAIY